MVMDLDGRIDLGDGKWLSKALLYKNYRKEEPPTETVTVLHIGMDTDENGNSITTSVERENGKVIEIHHERLQFLGKNFRVMKAKAVEKWNYPKQRSILLARSQKTIR